MQLVLKAQHQADGRLGWTIIGAAGYIASADYDTNAELVFYLRGIPEFQTSEAIRYGSPSPIDQSLLAQRTGKLSDVLAVETELGRVQGGIEEMEAERKNTESQVAYAAVQLNVGENYKAQLHVAPDSTPIRFRNTAIEGYRSMADGLIGFALLVVAYAPTVLLWAALLFFPARAIWRRYVRQASQPVDSERD